MPAPHVLLAVVALSAGACVPNPTALAPDLPIETGISFVNFSKTQYAAFRVRSHAGAGAPAEFFSSHLLAPGAAQRVRMLDAVGTGCAPGFDVQVFIYRRVNAGVPIGLDPGEQVEAAPVVAGQIFDLPACRITELETYSMVNFEAPAGTARVKFAQDTPVDVAIRDAGLFPNVDAAWEVFGVDPLLALTPPPALAPMVPITGRVSDPDGNGLEGVGALVRTRFRVRVNDDNPANDPDASFGDPIAVMATGPDGRFEFLRPAGGYQLEFFADGLAFRPVTLEIESPSQQVDVLAEFAP
jgi:hypothetical protein